MTRLVRPREGRRQATLENLARARGISSEDNLAARPQEEEEAVDLSAEQGPQTAPSSPLAARRRSLAGFISDDDDFLDDSLGLQGSNVTLGQGPLSSQRRRLRSTTIESEAEESHQRIILK